MLRTKRGKSLAFGKAKEKSTLRIIYKLCVISDFMLRVLPTFFQNSFVFWVPLIVCECLFPCSCQTWTLPFFCPFLLFVNLIEKNKSDLLQCSFLIQERLNPLMFSCHLCFLLLLIACDYPNFLLGWFTFCIDLNFLLIMWGYYTR